LSCLKLWFFTIDLLPDLIFFLWRTNFKSIPFEKKQCVQQCYCYPCLDVETKLQRWWLQSSWLYTSYIVLCQLWWSSFWRGASDDHCFWWLCFWWRVFRISSSDSFLQMHFFRCTSSDAFLQMHSSRHSKLQIKFLCSLTCSIRIFMNSTLIMDHVHLNKLITISNWWFLIPCYYQNSRGDFEKHPLFQQRRYGKILKLKIRYGQDTLIKKLNSRHLLKLKIQDYELKSINNCDLVVCPFDVVGINGGESVFDEINYV